MEKLLEFLKFRSISSDETLSAECINTAEWLVSYLDELGFQETKLLSTVGLPIVYAQTLIDPNKPTLLFYGHYDVQPPGEIQLWNTEPFEPIIKDEFIWGRGTADDKGQVLSILEGFGEAIKIGKNLNYNVKIIIEGEEEIGSLNTKLTLAKYKDLLKADYVLICDTEMHPNQPTIVSGLRGVVLFEISLTNADSDLHSGLFGGGVANPTIALSRMLGKVLDSEGVILIPQFYESVLENPTPKLKTTKKNKIIQKEITKSTGAIAFIENSKFTFEQMTTIRPTFEINAFHAGNQIETPSTIIPSKASAVISFRIVPNQSADKIVKQIDNYFQSQIPRGFKLKLKLIGKYEPARFNTDNKFLEKISKVSKTVWGAKPVFNNYGGSIGIVVEFKKILGIDSVLFGLSYHDANIHGPNENLPVHQYEKGKQFAKKLLLG